LKDEIKAEYVSWLEEVGARISMAAVGNPHEDTDAESFFRTLKMDGDLTEGLQDLRGNSREHRRVHRGVLYNHKRLHSSLWYLPSVEIEALHAMKGR
jgi:putative transposase